MPDLAPHAAAIFQDRSSIELARENQQLRDEFSRQCFLDGTVDIAGPAACNGISPAHAVGHIRDAKQQPHHKEEILVLLTNSSSVDRKDIDMRLPACPAQDIVKCALHFGGKALRIVGDTDDQLAVGSADERQEEMCCVFDSKGSSGEIEFKIALHIEWGPYKSWRVTEPFCHRQTETKMPPAFDSWVFPLKDSLPMTCEMILVTADSRKKLHLQIGRQVVKNHEEHFVTSCPSQEPIGQFNWCCSVAFVSSLQCDFKNLLRQGQMCVLKTCKSFL